MISLPLSANSEGDDSASRKWLSKRDDQVGFVAHRVTCWPSPCYYHEQFWTSCDYLLTPRGWLFQHLPVLDYEFPSDRLI
jgi:hypothetical protein